MIITFYFSIFQSEIVGHHNIAKGSFYQIWFERMIRIFYLMMIEDFSFRNHELHLWMITTNTDDQFQKGGLSNDNVFTDLFVFTLNNFQIWNFHVPSILQYHIAICITIYCFYQTSVSYTNNPFVKLILLSSQISTTKPAYQSTKPQIQEK